MTKTRQLRDIRNQVRGAIARLETINTGADNREQWKTHQKATEDLNKALSRARQSFPPSELSEFERWVDSLLSKGHVNTARIGVDLTRLGVLPRNIPQQDLASALALAFEALKRVEVQLRDLLSVATQIAIEVANRDWDAVDRRISRAIDQYGHSYWAIETRLAALNQGGKSDQAKELISRMSAGTAGLNSFFFYHFGLRSDPSQSISRYKTLSIKRVDDSELSKAYKTYARYRVAKLFPDDSADIARLLNYEQLTTRTDLLFTSLRTALHIISTRNIRSEGEIDVADKLLAFFANPLLANIVKKDVDSGLNIIVPTEIRAAIRESVLLAFRGTASPEPDSQTTFFAAGLASAMSFSGSEVNEELLRKVLINFSWSPEALILDCFPPLPKLGEIYAQLRAGKLANAHTHPLLDAYAVALHDYLLSPTNLGETLLSARLGLTGQEERPTQPIIDGELPIWQSHDLPDSASDCLAIDAAWEAFDAENYTDAIHICAHAAVRNVRLVPALPFQPLFGAVSWRKIATYGVSMELCVCLHAYLTLNDERQIRTFKRFGIEEYVRQSGAMGLENLGRKLVDSDKNRLLVEHFLVGVCDLPTLELLPEIGGTREALRLRSALLRHASAFSKTASAQLTAEADDIDGRLEVDSVLDVLDDSKVYVDEDPLIVLANKELSKDFERYTQLASSGVSRASSIEDFIKSLRQQSATVFQIPKNEADDLFVQMLSTLLDMFINHPVNGLDSVIGRRIRHGTISSELRGTLEHLQLIGQRPRTGAEYDEPKGVVQFSANLDANKRRATQNAFARFSAAIDALVIQLRDEVFQCKQKGKLRAAFEVSITPSLFTVASNLAGASTTVDVFARECFQIFWFVLSQIVERERPIVAEYTKRSLRDVFTKLMHDLRDAGVTDAGFLASIQRASEQLQHKAVLVASWVRIPRLSYEGKTYPLQLVFDAAMALVKSQRSGFEPVLTAQIEEGIHLDAHGFPIVHDALQIALDNIAEHSGIRKGNNISVSISLAPSQDKLSFTVVSDIHKDGWNKERAAKVEAIREDISKRVFADRAKRPSGSGLSRLAGIVHQNDACALEFGAIDENTKFQLHFELIYVSVLNPPDAPDLEAQSTLDLI